LSKDFLRLVLVAFVVAAPIAYFTMNRWLEGFAYHVTPGVAVFLLSAGFAVLTAFLTLSYQAIKAARSNPVEALRYE
jgi:putative ABC transport system permease protein